MVEFADLKFKLKTGNGYLGSFIRGNDMDVSWIQEKVFKRQIAVEKLAGAMKVISCTCTRK